MKENIKIYQESLEKNIDDISKILDDLEMTFPDLMQIYKRALLASSENIANKWASERKYQRTYFVQTAFSNFYPKEITELSLYIDAMVNILDDLFDENLNKEVKGLYILEFSRVFSLYNYCYPDKKIQEMVGQYFNKLIVLALTEDIYGKLIKEEKDLNKIVKYSAELLLCRAMDIDIFIEIALQDQGDKSDNIRKIGRIFRALSILKKDVKDIEHDTKNNIDTVITDIVSKKEILFNEYIESLIAHLLDRADKINKDDVSEEVKTPTEGFSKMIKNIIKEIKEII